MNRLVLVLVLVASLVLTAGCIGGDFEGLGVELDPDVEETDADDTGDEILASSVEAAQDAETYTVDADSRMAVSVSSFFSISVPLEANGSFDRGVDEARVDAEGEGEVEALVFFTNRTAFDTTRYVSDGTTYTRKAEDGAEVTDGWETADGGVDGMNLSLADTVSLYEDADAELEGAATVDGDDAYVLSLELDPADVGDHSERVTDAYGPDTLEGGDDESAEDEQALDDMTEGFDAYLWVDQETREPVRLSYFLSVEFEAEGDDDALISVDTDGKGEFFADLRYGYGDVNVERPDGVDG